MTPDLALALLIDRTTQAYGAHTPAYIVYRETTHISAPSLGRSQEIDRHVVVRNADDAAVMNDLPGGGRRVGQAFPIIPYFDAFSQFSFSYYSNLKVIDITLQRGDPITFATPPPDPDVDVVVPYVSFWDVRYAADSRPDRLHLLIAPTPRCGQCMYPAEVVEDPQTHLPSHVELHDANSDMIIALDYRIVDGYWIITHGTFTATEHVLFTTFKVTAEVNYDDFAFPAIPPPEAAALPPPTASPEPSPQ
ncbi:MAG TPA: hypothetical protein VIN40_04440 [Candidatus Tyrphobacter sp.]